MEELWALKAKIEALLVAADRSVTIPALAQCLDLTVEEAEVALREFEAGLLGADRGVQLRRHPQGIRIEIKPQYIDMIGRLLPERKAKPITTQALETLAIVALKQPVTLADINAIRGIESAGTVQTLRNRKLIAREARLGPRREKIWRTTQYFLDSFGLASPDELYKEGRMEEVFASVYSGQIGGDQGADPSDNGLQEATETQ